MREMAGDDSNRDAGDVTDSAGGTGWFQRHAEQPLVRSPDLGARGDAFLQVTLVLLAAFIAQTLFVSLGRSLLAGVGITEEATPVAFFGVQSALGLLAFLVVGLAYLVWRDDPGLVGISRPTGRDLLVVVVGLVVLLGLQFASAFLFDLLGIEPAENAAITRGRDHPMLFLVFIPLQFLFTGPGEELLFRGAIQGVLRRTYGLVPGIAFASALFALIHIPALLGGDVLPVLVVVFLSGVVLGAVYEYTRNLLVPILAHALLNTFLFGTQYARAVEMLFAG